MQKVVELNLKFNKASKQFVTSIPKKQLSPIIRKDLCNIKKLRVRIEDFEKW